MPQRNSKFERQPSDTYVTPKWVWETLYAVEPWARQAWDCAPVNANFDFLSVDSPEAENIATNPPYGRLAEKFLRYSLHLTYPENGKVAFLLPHSFDTAKGRVELFNEPPFKVKYTLTKRILWDNLPHTGTPSSNHAWYVWDWDYSGPAVMGWL